MSLVQDNFDVANLVGHPAFDHLAAACSAYRWVHEQKAIDPSAHAWPKCLGYGAQISSLRSSELKACVHAVVMFQAMMEKIPFFIDTVGTGLKRAKAGGFAASWTEMLDQLSSPTDKAQATAEFSAYNTGVYSGMRNPIIHGRKATDISQVNAIRTPDLHAGMKAGWRAYDYLLAEAFKGQGQPHQPSWSSMCAAHGVPETLEAGAYPDLSELSARYMKRHLEGAQTATGPKGTDGA